MPSNVTRRVAGTWTQLLSTELNSLANNAGARQVVGTNPAYDNTNAANLYFAADFELVVTFGTNPTANTAVDLYILPLGSDGSTYADGAGGATPVTNNATYAASFQIRATTSAQRIILEDIPIPGEQFIVLVVNNGTGQGFPASGSTLKMRPQGQATT